MRINKEKKMKKQNAYAAIILTAIALMLFVVSANASPSATQRTTQQDFELRLICQHELNLVGGGTSFLGTFVAGQAYTLPSGQTGTTDNLEFELIGATGETYVVKSNGTPNRTVTNGGGDAVIEIQWYNDYTNSGYTTCQLHDEDLDWQHQLTWGTPEACDGKAYFKIEVTDISIGSNVAHGTNFEFPVTVTADVIL